MKDIFFNPPPRSGQAILERLMQGAALRRQSQLAELLEVSPQAVSQAWRKGRVPDAWIIKVAQQFNLSADWLLFGRGEAGSEGISGQAFLPSAARLPQQTQSHKPTVSSAITPVLSSGVAAPAVECAFVPLVAARLAAGQGSLENEGEVLDHFPFPLPWLQRLGNPERMTLMRVTGDSMEPAILHGDMVLVDQGKTSILGHAIYAVGVNEEIYIKQLETLPGNRLVLRSLNSRYQPIEVSLAGDLADSVRIIGRVMWWCREA